MVILLTGLRPGRVAAELAAAGHRVLHHAAIATAPLPVDARAFDGADWVVVTSATGAELLPPGLPARIAAVGVGTAAALSGRGYAPALVGDAGGAELARQIPDVAGRRVVFAGAAEPAGGLLDVLREGGAEVVQVALYRTQTAATAAPPPAADVVVFSSPSAVRGYLEQGGGKDRPVVTIGTTTTAAAEAAGMAVAAQAPAPTAAGLAAALNHLEVIVDG